MKQLLVLFVFSMSTSLLMGQDETPIQSDTTNVLSAEDEVFSMSSQMPEYPGGVEALKKYIDDQVQYPAYCIENSIQGTIYVSFIIEKNGSTSNHKIVRSVSYGEELNREALRICKTLVGFTPGMEDGQPVRVHYTVPVKFSLSDERKKKKK